MLQISFTGVRRTYERVLEEVFGNQRSSVEIGIEGASERDRQEVLGLLNAESRLSARLTESAIAVTVLTLPARTATPAVPVSPLQISIEAEACGTERRGLN